MARRIVNRMEKRAEVEAFERRKDEDEDEGEEEEEGEEEDGDEEEEAEGEEEEEEGDEEEEEAPKKKKPKAPAKPKAKPRSRAAKTTRMRVVWRVFTNSQQKVADYEYPRRAEAIAHAERLTAEKRSTHFVQPVKEPIVEEKEKK